MNDFYVVFSVTSSGKTQTYKATELKKNKEMFRISFPCAEDGGISYTITLLGGEKITLACDGGINYSFSLIKNKKSRFNIDLLGSTVDCEVYCTALSVSVGNGKILASGKYELNVGGNANDFSFTLRGNYDN